LWVPLAQVVVEETICTSPFVLLTQAKIVVVAAIAAGAASSKAADTAAFLKRFIVPL
jgi:hypothetical protein